MAPDRDGGATAGKMHEGNRGAEPDTNTHTSFSGSLPTCVVLHQLLQRLKLGPGGDIISAVVQLADLVVFDVVALHLIPVPDGQRVGTFKQPRSQTLSCLEVHRC